MNTTFLQGLNERQVEAVSAPVANTLILAGAGSGKTRVLVSRMAWLIEQQHFSPHAILAVTFTNKAAFEMKQRLRALLSTPIEGLWVGTFHGLCHRLLRRHYKEAHLPEQFHILDAEDQLRAIKRVVADLQLDPEKWPYKQAQHYINRNKDEGLRPQHIEQTYGPAKTWLAIYKAYEQACQTAGVIDFAELLLRTLELLRDNSDLLAHYQQRFQAILVDEFQDTNTIQYAWIKLLAGANAAVMAVGDDDQSIYGWRGAKVENIMQFSRDFKNTQIIRLEQNYRSTATILQAANALITNNDKRMGKELWTSGSMGDKILLYCAYNELDEARFVCERITMEIKQGMSALDVAILYRSNAQSRVIEEALLRAGIAYRIYGGVRFFDRQEIKDALAYLRLLINPDDDSAFDRVINFPTRGIGEKTYDDLRSFAQANNTSLWSAANKLLQSLEIKQRSALALSKFIKLIEQLQLQIIDKTLEEQIACVVHGSGLHAHFSTIKSDNAQSKLDNLQELINAAKQFRSDEGRDNDRDNELPLVNAFLAHASLESGEMQAEHNAHYVHLMTLHAAKGLEFPLVFLVGMEEGIFPNRQSLEEPGRLQEERRLCYVGMTRAMQKLVISYAEIRRLYGREEYHKASRFLQELPEHLVDSVRVKAYFKPQAQVSSKSFVQQNHSGLCLGQNVEHAKFGFGIVLAIEGSGPHTRVQVRFANEEVKWLVVAYANLVPC